MAKTKLRVNERRAPGAPTRVLRAWNLPPGCTVRKVILRELDGNDDLVAAANVERFAPKTAMSSMQAFSMAQQRERVRLSIVAVDGRTVVQPFLDMDHGDAKWTMKTIRHVEGYWLKMNGITDEEMADFDEGGAVVSADELAPPDYGTPDADEEGNEDEDDSTD